MGAAASFFPPFSEKKIRKVFIFALLFLQAAITEGGPKKLVIYSLCPPPPARVVIGIKGQEKNKKKKKKEKRKKKKEMCLGLPRSRGENRVHFAGGKAELTSLLWG